MKFQREYQKDDVYMPAVIFKRLAVMTVGIFIVLGCTTYLVVKNAGF